ncbi:MAG: N-6 DNA methylase [Candidatus Methanoperedens sp.]|nr:N-6 DNA methylase [Candidatus Methanoperedens sp.]CAG0982210.1 Restriction enzyme BgcI subunit alpha [Methanosarcinales archaeon]
MNTEKKSEETSEGNFQSLCSELDLTKQNGLVEVDIDTNDEFQKFILKQAKEKLNIDAIFFLKPIEGKSSVPLIYLCKLEYPDNKKIAEFHQKVWNVGQAPLLFLVLPGSVLIYNAYEPPIKLPNGELDYKAGFIEELNLYIQAETEIKKRREYHSSELVTGRYWQKHSEIFNKEKRVYQTLLDNLGFMSDKLIEEGLSPDIVHSLLSRSIFIKYLEDRKDKNNCNVFPEKFFEQYKANAKGFTDLLSDKEVTYKFFKDLNSKFNGDLFVFENEEKTVVTQKHLKSLQKLLKGETYLGSGQMVLWPLYSFDVIPIELISNIYQQFFHNEKNKDNKETNGTYYTPYHLVLFLMDEVLPWNEKNTDIKILDPSCGSGIFLVEAYRRLIGRWMLTNPDKNIKFSDLSHIIKENIFGVDINGQAIRIAALSLYLTLCDYLEPRDIWKEEVKFQPLLNRNLFTSDFFMENSEFLNKKYDIIIGNPPWESELTGPARRYKKMAKKPVGDKQISQAFLWRVAELCKPDARVCLIVSSKGLLFNRSEPNRKFREQFFSTNVVKTIINLSALRHILFSKQNKVHGQKAKKSGAIGPGAAVIFSPGEPDDHSIFYCSPKPDYSPQDDWLLIIEPQDIAYVPNDEAIENDIIWKVMMWGTPRDYELIKRLSGYPTLGKICDKKDWIHGEGFIIGNRKDENLELFGKPYVDVRKLQRFTMEEESLPFNQETHYYRSAKTKKEVFYGPHLLIKQSPKVGVGLIAALLRKDAVFKHAILGIHCKESDLNQLAACCLFINTNLALYYEMLTSRSWLVERDAFESEEILDIPMPNNIFDLDNFNFEFLKDISKNPKADEVVNELVTELYGLNESEMILIDDSINYILDFFRKKGESIAIEPVNEKIIKEYINTLCKVLNNSFSSPMKVFIGICNIGNSPLTVVSVSLENKSDNLEIRVHTKDDELKKVLDGLEKILLQERSPSIYIRRNIRRYAGNTISIVKPNQNRYWNKSSALRDADEIYAEIMSFWGDSN